jgi:hypothetical protein
LPCILKYNTKSRSFYFSATESGDYAEQSVKK